MNNDLIYRAFRGEVTASELAALQAWRRASKENEAHFRQVTTLLQLIADRPPIVSPDDAPTAATLAVRAGPPMDVGRTSQSAWRRARRWWPAVAAAALATIWIGVTELRQQLPALSAFGADEIVTAGAEPTTVHLVDGTIVRLAPNSRLRVESDTRDRVVSLQGRAYLSVASRPGSSFTVRTPAGDAIVLGTRFQVEATNEQVRVVVVEGRVALRSPEGVLPAIQLGAGEMSEIVAGAVSSAVEVPDVHRVVDWAGRVLVFNAAPLDSVAAELEREYDAAVEIADPVLAERTISGWFVDRSLEEVVAVVCAAIAAGCSTHDGVVRIGGGAAPGAR